MSVLHLNSQFRSGGTFADYYISIPNTIKEITKIKLLDVTIKLTYYVFNTSNNTIPFIEQATPLVTRNAVITPGNYNVTDIPIMTQIATAMTAVGTQTYTCTYNASTSLLTISAAAAFSLQFSGTTDPDTRLGFAAGSDTAYATSQTSTQPINLSPGGCFFINIDGMAIPTTLVSDKQPANTNFIICITGNSNDTIVWQNTRYPIYNITGFNNSFRVTICDSKGQLVPMNSDWQMTFVYGNSESVSDWI
jgi:hypothetical protein